MRRRLLILALALGLPLAPAQGADAPRITILSDAFARDAALDKDWGFAALVETGGKRILFDTGNDGDHLVANARRLEVDLAHLDAAVVSHRHGDHTNGLRHVLALNPGLTVYVPNDEHFMALTPRVFFAHSEPSLPRHMRYFDGNVPEGVPHGRVLPEGRYAIVAEAREIFPGVRLVSNLSAGPHFTETPELSMIVEGKAGRILVVGCSHPGIERILASARAKEEGIRLLVGGLHLVTTPPEEVGRLAIALRDEWKLGGVAPGHCTGEHAFAALRDAFGKRWVYAGAGASFDVTSMR